MPSMHVQEGDPIIRRSESAELRKRIPAEPHPQTHPHPKVGNNNNTDNIIVQKSSSSKSDAPWANKSLTDSQRLKRAAAATVKAAEVSSNLVVLFSFRKQMFPITYVLVTSRLISYLYL